MAEKATKKTETITFDPDTVTDFAAEIMIMAEGRKINTLELLAAYSQVAGFELGNMPSSIRPKLLAKFVSGLRREMARAVTFLAEEEPGHDMTTH
jgi:hypothetical protein